MSKRRVASTLPRPQHSKIARRISCRHWKDIPTAAIAAATTAADETAMIYMRGSKGSCQSGQPRTAAASRARREREGTSIPVSTSHLDRRVMIAGRGVPVSHSYRSAVYVRRVPDLHHLVTSARHGRQRGINSTFTTPGRQACSFRHGKEKPHAKGGAAAMRENIWG